jgi:ATP-dependent helicase/nuclease subunit B
VLHGRIDRIDRGPGGALELVDYKTGSASTLSKRLARRTEDTQLPFYVALVDEAGATRALYLTLDGGDSAKSLPHPDVQDTAALMLEQLAQEWARLQAGAPLPALGEAEACEHCDARGLCRRDHWGAR